MCIFQIISYSVKTSKVFDNPPGNNLFVIIQPIMPFILSDFISNICPFCHIAFCHIAFVGPSGRAV